MVYAPHKVDKWGRGEFSKEGGIMFKDWPIILVFVGAILIAIGTLFSALRQQKSDKEIAELNKKIAGLVSGGDSYNGG